MINEPHEEPAADEEARLEETFHQELYTEALIEAFG